MNGRFLAISILGLLTCFSAKAQKGAAKDTVIKGATIEIIQSYTPEVKRSPRPTPTPSLPPVDTTTPVLQHHVPAQTLFYSYGSLPLRPLALTLSEEETGYENYVKLGGGNQSTLYLDAGVGSLKGNNYETAILFNHLSQSGSIDDQKVSLTGADARGVYRNNGKAFGAQLGIHHNRFHYYGYDHSKYTYPLNAVRQAFTDLSLAVDMKDELSDGKKFSYHPNISAGLFTDKFNASETSFGISVPTTYIIDSNTQVYANVHLNITGFNNSVGSQSNNIFQIAPGIRFSKGIFTGHAGISPTIGSTATYFLPDVAVNFTLPGTQFMFFAEWEGRLMQNSYKQLTTLNPYMSNLYRVQQTQSTEIYGGIKSNLGKHVSFDGKLSWWQYNGLPIFINDTAGDKKQFLLLYDTRVNAIGLQAGIRYHIAETFSVGFSGQWMNFVKKSYAEVWHRPGVTFKGDVLAMPMKKLTINAYISFIDELYALDNGNRTLKLSSILDIGAGAEYEIIKRLNVFVQANNLLNSKYQRWYGYDAFGMNIFAGARLKF
ncbi:MAG: hypothetical protein H3C54_11655 [Taibaiella sp.]|nr:hypothetical protein [Taibaiella sp.]